RHALPGADVDTTLRAAFGRGTVFALGPGGIRQAAADVWVGRVGTGARVRQARAWAEVHAASGLTLLRRAILALGCGIVGQAAAHIVGVDRVGGDGRLLNGDLVVNHGNRLAPGIDAEQLVVPSRPRVEPDLARATTTRRERADEHALDRDVERRR